MAIQKPVRPGMNPGMNQGMNPGNRIPQGVQPAVAMPPQGGMPMKPGVPPPSAATLAPPSTAQLPAGYAQKLMGNLATLPPPGTAQQTAMAKKGGKVKAKKMASGGKTSSASKRADGCCVKGKTKGRYL